MGDVQGQTPHGGSWGRPMGRPGSRRENCLGSKVGSHGFSTSRDYQSFPTFKTLLTETSSGKAEVVWIFVIS